MLPSYAPGHPDIGSAVSGGTASTGVDVISGVTIGIVILVVAIICCLAYMVWDARRRRGV